MHFNILKIIEEKFFLKENYFFFKFFTIQLGLNIFLKKNCFKNCKNYYANMSDFEFLKRNVII